MKINDTIKLIICIVISEMAGIIGAIFMVSTGSPQAGWYALLVKPTLNPPSWVFGPVWTTLYLMMGISVWLVWKEMDSRLRGNDRQGGNPSERIVRADDIKERSSSDQVVRASDKRKEKIAFFVFGIQLVLNTFWSIIFFGMHQPGAAFVEIIFLAIAIIATIISFYKISKLAAWLLVPYIIWVCFASYLNFSLWDLNPSTSSGQAQQVACTQEAKLCPDGSAVGRTGKNCEFATCPDSDIKYENNKYGFNFILPISWKGYSVIAGNWEGRNQENIISENGPEISIRHPQWTSENPRQDIPIMIFTISQWNLLQQDNFHIGAAPINPSELGRNSHYVFALPARYNFAFPEGYEEVDQILQNKPLQTFDLNPVIVKIEGSIAGKVTIGPLCPVEPCSNLGQNPYISRRIILQSKADKNNPPVYININSDGSFEGNVPEGDYDLTISDCSFLGCRYATPKIVTIKPKEVTEVNINIDTGIR